MVEPRWIEFDRLLREKYEKSMESMTGEEARSTAIVGTPPDQLIGFGDDVKMACTRCSAELHVRPWLKNLMDKHGITNVWCVGCAFEKSPKDALAALLGGGTNMP